MSISDLCENIQYLPRKFLMSAQKVSGANYIRSASQYLWIQARDKVQKRNKRTICLALLLAYLTLNILLFVKEVLVMLLRVAVTAAVSCIVFLMLVDILVKVLSKEGE